MAKYPARIFAKLIQQQLEAGIQVNIIAHSLGSLVVLNILQLLAEAGLCVEHTFLWQSAVPNTIFQQHRLFANMIDYIIICPWHIKAQAIHRVIFQHR